MMRLILATGNLVFMRTLRGAVLDDEEWDGFEMALLFWEGEALLRSGLRVVSSADSDFAAVFFRLRVVFCFMGVCCCC